MLLSGVTIAQGGILRSILAGLVAQEDESKRSTVGRNQLAFLNAIKFSF